MKKTLVTLVAGALSGIVFAAVEWEAPIEYSQAGLPFADGVQGVLVWGATNVLKVTVGRADLWDHRGGYEWTTEQTYKNIKDCLQRGDTGGLGRLFDKKVAPGEVRNPYMLPLGHCEFDLGAWQLEGGSLDPFTGTGTLRLVDGAKRAEIRMALADGRFAIEWPAGLEPAGRAICAWNSPAVRRPLEAVGFAAPKTWGDAKAAGFEWAIPGDPTVSLAFATGAGRTVLSSVRGGRAAPALKGAEGLIAAAERKWADWWRDAARVSVPDPVIQEIYDYNFYRFGAMTDPSGVPAPLQGPWYEENKLPPWNGDYHFNINIQECYWAAYLGNKPRHLLPLFRMVKGWWPRLKDNARKYCGVEDGFMLPHSVDDRGNCIGGFWSGTIDHGSTAWLAQMMFRYVDVTGDLEFLRTDAYPFMKGAMKVYRAMMEEYHGRLSIAATTSPEWWGMGLPDDGWGRDASFQLAACHRLCRDLVRAAEMLGEKPDPMWLEVEKRLPQYSVARQTSCVRKTNEEIGVFDGFRLAESHRHHSHMAGLVPFDTIDFEADETTRNVVRETYITWVQLGPGLWSGWSMPWAAMLQARIGMGDMAALTLRTWNDVFTNPGHGSRHNGWFPGFSMMKGIFTQNGEGGGEIMQMDGAACVPAAVQEMLCHERQGVVRLFAGAPSKWKKVSFRNFLVGGGFLVSAARENGVVTLDVKATRPGTFRWQDPATGEIRTREFK